MVRIACLAAALFVGAVAVATAAPSRERIPLSLQTEVVLSERTVLSSGRVVLCGRVTEPFVLPLDPDSRLERTGFACMDEEDFPFPSVDSEEVDSFYDTETLRGDLTARITCRTSASPRPRAAACVASGDLAGHGAARATVQPRDRTLRIQIELSVKCRRCATR